MTDSKPHPEHYDMTPEKALRLLEQFVKNEAPESSDGYPLRSLLLGDIAVLRGREKQLERYEQALIRVRDWRGFRHTGEVRDCAGEALRGR